MNLNRDIYLAGIDIPLSIVLLNYNRLEQTRITIRNLLKFREERPLLEIIAVDNGSNDGTPDFLRSHECEGVTTVLLESNIGIEGYNKGFMLSKTDYIFVLDDDSCPSDLRCLDLAVSVLCNINTIGIIACKIVGEDGKVQSSWHLPDRSDPGPSPFFVGCGFCIRRSLFRQIGWYPGHFFLYQNEVEVANLVRMAGYSIWYHPECQVVHRSKPADRPGWRKVYYPTRNTLWLIRRYYSGLQRIYMLISRLIIGFFMSMRHRQFGAYLRAVGEGLNYPLEHTPISRNIRNEVVPFFRQNSIIHQILRRA